MRWWPALLILVGAFVAVAFIWGSDAPLRQLQVVNTALTLIVSTGLLLLWLTFFSKLPWKKRLQGWGIVILMTASSFLMFRYRGVSGDLVPVLEPRWAGAGEGVTGDRLDGPASAHDYPQFLGPPRVVLESQPHRQRRQSWTSRLRPGDARAVSVDGRSNPFQGARPGRSHFGKGREIAGNRERRPARRDGRR